MDLNLIWMLVVYFATLGVVYLLRKPLRQWRDGVSQRLGPNRLRALIVWLLDVFSIVVVMMKLLWDLFTRGWSFMGLLQGIGAYGIMLGFWWLVWFLLMLVLIVVVSSLGVAMFPLTFLEAYVETRDAHQARAQASSVSLAALRLPWGFYLIEGALCLGALMALMSCLTASNQPGTPYNEVVALLWWLGSIATVIWIVKLVWQGRLLWVKRA